MIRHLLTGLISAWGRRLPLSTINQGMQSASSSLSVEIWQTILRYSIGIEGFLDPDAFEGALSQHQIGDGSLPRNDEAVYWDTEKTRTNLRCVSKSWNEYLSTFRHRFVRMLDIRHGVVDRIALRGAIRVSFGRYKCLCREYCGAAAPLLSSFTDFCKEVLEEVESTNMQIADCMDENHEIREFAAVVRGFENVRTFIGPLCTYSGYLASLLNNLPSIRQFYGKGFWGTREHGGIRRLSSQHLTTLSIHTRRGARYDTLTWDLPSLLHLRLKDDSGELLPEFLANSVLPLLRALGSNLLTLYMYSESGYKEAVPYAIWDLCPRLTTLRTALEIGSPPPFFHPISTLIVSHERQLGDFPGRPEWSQLRLVVLDIFWAWRGSEPMIHHLSERKNLRVEDRNGLTWAESQLLKAEGQVPKSFSSHDDWASSGRMAG